MISDFQWRFLFISFIFIHRHHVDDKASSECLKRRRSWGFLRSCEQTYAKLKSVATQQRHPG